MRALVVGAGIAGLTAALTLRRAGWSVRLVEVAPQLRDQGYAVPVRPEGVRVLAELEVLGALPDTPLEWERGEIIRALAGEFARAGGVIEFGVDAAEVFPPDSTCDVVLAADGVDSPTRGLAGLEVPGFRRPLGYRAGYYADGVVIVPAHEGFPGEPWRTDDIVQVHLPRWSTGNLMLIGDAAAACGACTGFSTTVALVMAHNVATQLVAGRTLQQAEERLRPWVTAQQAAAAQHLPGLRHRPPPRPPTAGRSPRPHGH